MDEMDNLHVRIKRDTRLVFTMSNLVGTFPYHVHSLKPNKFFTLWTIIIYATILRLLTASFKMYEPKTSIDFYAILLLKSLVCVLFILCAALLYNTLTMGKQLRAIFLELNRVHSYFIQLSCDDVTPNEVEKKQLWTISLFIIINLITLSYRLIALWEYGLALTCSLYMINFVTFSTVLQCTNLLDLVKHYLNIINIELINISNNQDKQHFIHLYKSRICVLNNMLPENYLSRRKLKVMVQLHLSLCKLSQDIVNRAYSLPLFALMLIQSFHLTCFLYLAAALVLQSGNMLSVLHHTLYFTAWVSYDLFILVWIIHHCDSTKCAGLSLLELVYHKIIYNETPLLNTELTHFLDLICTHRIQFRALNVFEIDYTVLRHMMGAVITYGVIFVQLSFAT